MSLRIVHLDTGEELRGGQQQLLMLARGLAARGHEQLIVTLDGTMLEAQARKAGLRVFTLPRHDPANAHGILQLRQLLRTERPDVLHAHDGKGQTISWLASLGLRVVRVASRRVTFAPARHIDTRVKYGHLCDAVIAVSHFIKKLLMDAGVPESRIELIPDGVEIPETLPEAAARASARAAWQVNENDFAVGHLGALTYEKGHDIALQAAAWLDTKMPTARLVLATGAEGGRLPRAANIRVLAYQKDLTAFFAGLDLYMMPSRAEGLGSSALVAMAHGIPVVATRVGGLPELIEDGETGWLIPPGDAPALAKAIVHAEPDRTRLRIMGQKARERAQQFSSTLLVERTASLYERLHRENSSELRVES